MQKLKYYFPHILLFIYLTEFLILAINPLDRNVWWAENIPILFVVTLLVTTYKKFRFSNLSYFLMSFFLMFHTIGGHFTFEKVPFDFFNNFLNSLHLDFLFNEGRNNFDRVGHFLVGIFALPVAEFLYRMHFIKNKIWSFIVGILFMGFWGSFYEIIEMVYAIKEGGSSGSAFLGSQGDIWDAQKDMLLDILGGITFGCLIYLLPHKKVNITIDGPAGSGKSSTAKEVAKRLNYTYLDSGAIYRAITFYFVQKNISHKEIEKIKTELPKIDIKLTQEKVFLNNKDVSSDIRSEEINKKIIGTYPFVPEIRKKVETIIKNISKNNKGFVVDGRDAGDILIPHAELKIYLDATPEVRAKRRANDFHNLTEEKQKEVLEDLIKRDETDISALNKAKKNGVYIDTSNLNFEKQVNVILKLISLSL